MERLIFRSTSITHLQAELRQHQLLADARRRAIARSVRRPRTGFRVPLLGLRLRGPGWA